MVTLGGLWSVSDKKKKKNILKDNSIPGILCLTHNYELPLISITAENRKTCNTSIMQCFLQWDTVDGNSQPLLPLLRRMTK